MLEYFIIILHNLDLEIQPTPFSSCKFIFTCSKKYLTQSRTLYIIKINQELQVSRICIKIRASFVETRECNYFALSERTFKKKVKREISEIRRVF